MRARKCWWRSASATTAFFPLIHVVYINGCGSFHGRRRVSSTRRSASSSLTPVCRHRALSLTEIGRWIAVWRWSCCQMILLAALQRGAFRAVFIPYDYIRASPRCCSGGILPSTSILATQVQRKGPKTHSHTFILQNIQPPQCWFRPTPIHR